MNNQKDEKQITTAHQTLENIMKIAFGSPDFEKFGLASPPPLHFRLWHEEWKGYRYAHGHKGH